MGMTFPLAMAAIRKLSSSSQRSFSFLYVANVLGAVVGALLPAFVLVEIFADEKTAKPAVVSSAKLILSMLFLTGLVSLAMEVVWIRQFTVFIGTEVYAFASILGSYLIVTFIGSRIYRKWLQRYSPSDETVAWPLLGLAGLLPLLASDPRLPMIGVLRVPLGIMPVSGLMGFVTPMLLDQDSEGDPDRAGRAYAVNVMV